MHILLVEPDLKLAHIYSRALEHDGHQVTHSSTAQQGILAADARTPDVVVLELQLVAHSGIEFLHEFRSYGDWQQVPIILCTNVSPREFRGSKKLLERLGVTAYHYKPDTSLKALRTAVADAGQTTLGVEGGV